MRRVNRPHKRQNIKKQDLILDILEEDKALFVNMRFENLSDYHFPDKAKIFLEVYNKTDIEHISLGEVCSFSGAVKKPIPVFQDWRN